MAEIRKWLVSGIAAAFAVLVGYLVGMAHSGVIEANGRQESIAIGLAASTEENTAAADFYAGGADRPPGHAFVKAVYIHPSVTIEIYLAGALVALGLVAWAAFRRERLTGQLLFAAIAGYMIGMAHGTAIAEIPLWDHVSAEDHVQAPCTLDMSYSASALAPSPTETVRREKMAASRAAFWTLVRSG